MDQPSKPKYTNQTQSILARAKKFREDHPEINSTDQFLEWLRKHPESDLTSGFWQMVLMVDSAKTTPDSSQKKTDEDEKKKREEKEKKEREDAERRIREQRKRNSYASQKEDEEKEEQVDGLSDEVGQNIKEWEEQRAQMEELKKRVQQTNLKVLKPNPEPPTATQPPSSVPSSQPSPQLSSQPSLPTSPPPNISQIRQSFNQRSFVQRIFNSPVGQNVSNSVGNFINSGANRSISGVNNLASNLRNFGNFGRLGNLFGGGAGAGATGAGGAAAGGAAGAAGGAGGSAAAAGGIVAGGWVIVIIVVVILIIVILLTVLSGVSSQSSSPSQQTSQPSPLLTPFPGGAGCPSDQAITDNRKEGSCRYLNPSIDIFDTNISSSAIENYINKYSPQFVSAKAGDADEFQRRVNYIINKSKEATLNPAIFLSYWKSESGLSTVSTRHMGCAGDTFEEEVNCALGMAPFDNPQKNPIANCARSKDANSVACKALKSVRSEYDKTHPIQYPIKTFDDFAEAYGPYDHLNALGLHSNCNSTYNILLSVMKELDACKTTTPSITPGQPGNFVYYCQNSPQWAQGRKFCGDPFAFFSCGPTSMAMVFSSSGKTMTPSEMFDTFQNQNFFACEGTKMQDILNNAGSWLSNNGFVSYVISAGGPMNVDLLRKFLSEGYYVIGSQYMRGTSHIFVVDGIDSKNMVQLRDPAGPCAGLDGTDRKEMRPIDYILSYGKPGNWMYAYAVKKVR